MVMGRRKRRLDEYRADLAAGEEVLCGICHLPIHLEDSFKGFTGTPFLGELTIDHILPVKHGGRARRDNLQPAHKKCNSYKGDELVYIFQDKHAQRVFRAYAKIKNSLRHRWHPPLQLHGHLQRLKSTYDFVSQHPVKVVQEHRTPRLEWGWFELCLELCQDARAGEHNQGEQVPREVRPELATV